MPASISLNRLLALLLEEERQTLMIQAEMVSLRHLEELYPVDAPIDSVYFPLNAVASILLGAGQGHEIAIATIGNEGMLGSAAVLGIPRVFGRTLVQAAGTALKLRVEVLRAHLERRPMLQALLTRYLYALTRHIAQTSVCRGLHSMEERCASWLLMMQDRTSRDTLVLTQQFLAEMIGVRRATVNLALRLFKRTGVITYVRGRIQILNRAELVACACPCYAIIEAEYRRLVARRAS